MAHEIIATPLVLLNEISFGSCQYFVFFRSGPKAASVFRSVHHKKMATIYYIMGYDYDATDNTSQARRRGAGRGEASTRGLTRGPDRPASHPLTNPACVPRMASDSVDS